MAALKIRKSKFSINSFELFIGIDNKCKCSYMAFKLVMSNRMTGRNSCVLLNYET